MKEIIAARTLADVVGLVAVTELNSLVHTGRRARGDRSAEAAYTVSKRCFLCTMQTTRTLLSVEINLDGRVAARVEDLSGADVYQPHTILGNSQCIYLTSYDLGDGHGGEW